MAKTKAQKRREAAEAHKAMMDEEFAIRIAARDMDPDHPWHTDPVWNPRAEGYGAVQQAFAGGAQTWEQAIWLSEGFVPLEDEDLAPVCDVYDLEEILW